MIDKLPKLFKGTQLLDFIPVVYLFEVGSEFDSIADKTDFQEVEEEQKVEIFALLELHFVFSENSHHTFDIIKNSFTLIFKFFNPAQTS